MKISKLIEQAIYQVLIQKQVISAYTLSTFTARKYFRQNCLFELQVDPDTKQASELNFSARKKLLAEHMKTFCEEIEGGRHSDYFN